MQIFVGSIAFAYSSKFCFFVSHFHVVMRRVSWGYGLLLEGVSCAWSVEVFDVVRIDILLFGLLSFDCADIVLRVACQVEVS